MDMFIAVILPCITAGLWVGVAILGCAVEMKNKEKDDTVSLAGVPPHPRVPARAEPTGGDGGSERVERVERKDD